MPKRLQWTGSGPVIPKKFLLTHKPARSDRPAGLHLGGRPLILIGIPKSGIRLELEASRSGINLTFKLEPGEMRMPLCPLP